MSSVGLSPAFYDLLPCVRGCRMEGGCASSLYLSILEYRSLSKALALE
jgi:hypothetical protein